MAASQPFVPETPEQAATADKNYLSDDLATRLAQRPLQWRLVVTIAQPGDPSNDATLPWPDTRQQIDFGTLTIDQIESETQGNCHDVNFDPLVLPAGIEPSDDPLLSARSAAYAVSFTRRAEGTQRRPGHRHREGQLIVPRHPQFTLFTRLLHWLMAALILAMLYIGIGMVGSLDDYARLVAIHKPLGMLLLVLVAIRLLNRHFHPAPPLPQGMPGWQRLVAHASHAVLYAPMIALPLVGWGMLSAAGYPIVLYGALQLPPILPHDVLLYAWLRTAHTTLALLLFLTILAHLAAALLHGLVCRHGVLQSMLPWWPRG